MDLRPFIRRNAVLETNTLPGSTQQPVNPSTRIEAEAERRLHGSSSFFLRKVTCEFHEGVLTLRGQLPSYHHKQMAQELVFRIDGVEKIENRIDVVDADPSTWLG